MKAKIFTFVITTIVLITLTSQQSIVDYSLARVNKTNNKFIFFRNEPKSDYEIVFTFENSIPNFDCKSPQSLIDATLINANKEAINQNKLYEAIIITKSNRDIAISFNNKSNDNSIARVNKTNGKYVFIECEPLTNYEIVGKYDVNDKEGCSSIEEKIEKLMKKSSSFMKKFDAIIYGSTKYDLGIKFK